VAARVSEAEDDAALIADVAGARAAAEGRRGELQERRDAAARERDRVDVGVDGWGWDGHLCGVVVGVWFCGMGSELPCRSTALSLAIVQLHIFTLHAHSGHPG